MLEISTRHAALILAAAARDPAVEACGLLLGEGRRVTAVRPCRNVAADPKNSFEIDPVALLAAHRAARTGGQQVIGCWHSHPNGRAEPSPRDLAAAEVGSLWIIAAGGELTAWRREADGFTPLVIPALSRDPSASDPASLNRAEAAGQPAMDPGSRPG